MYVGKKSFICLTKIKEGGWKMKNLWVIAVVMAVFLIVPLAQAAGPDDILGKWLNDKKTSNIEIYKSGDRYDGKIVWLKEPVYPPDDKKGMAGKTKVDRENPDPALRNKPLLGTVLLWGFKYKGDNVWESGSIYDPENGKTYSCKMTLVSPDTLNIRGFIGISLLGRTTTWTRVK
jgi:uncharacterized protein (DUF2147 family)